MHRQFFDRVCVRGLSGEMRGEMQTEEPGDGSINWKMERDGRLANEMENR